MKIMNLNLYTTNLERQVIFYRDQIGFKCIKTDSRSAVFQIGSTTLSFIKKDDTTPYHFAINIPEVKILEATKWLKKKLNLIEIEIDDFNSWNAKAIYFHDKDQNIVEFIARKGIGHFIDQEGFDLSQCLCISEIGIGTSSVDHIREQILNKTGILPYGDLSPNFNALGDKEGLFIVIYKDERKWYPFNDIAFPSDFEADIKKDNTNYLIKYEKTVFSIDAKK